MVPCPTLIENAGMAPGMESTSLAHAGFGKEADVRSDRELGWLFAAAESHSIVLEAGWRRRGGLL